MFELEFAYAHGQPLQRAQYRVQWDDFGVEEDLGFAPSGSGEHLYLHLQKRGVNTEWLAKQLAAAVGIKPMDVGFCGLKDRHANTRQWFSLYLPKAPALDWAAVLAATGEDVQLLSSAYSHKKLRRGDHAGNRFRLILRQLSAPAKDYEARLQVIKAWGVPNYFGEQRFGHQRQNLPKALRLLAEPKRRTHHPERAMAMSALRAYGFNAVLHRALQTTPFAELRDRTGPLWGRGRLQGDWAAFEGQALADVGLNLDCLEHCGLNQERRPFWLPLPDLHWQFNDQGLQLNFSLGAGQYATAVLRELAQVSDASVKFGLENHNTQA